MSQPTRQEWLRMARAVAAGASAQFKHDTSTTIAESVVRITDQILAHAPPRRQRPKPPPIQAEVGPCPRPI